MHSSGWSAIDWQQKTLLVIADVSKNKREHLILLTESALQELASMKGLTKEAAVPIFFLYRPTVSARCTPAVWRVPSCISGPLILSLQFSQHEIDVSAKHYERYDYLTEKRRALEIWAYRVNNFQRQQKNNVVNLFWRR
ncbi:MAG: hypothetical protein RSB25_07515 [Acinetobacter sp.]